MRAARFYGGKDIRVEEVPTPLPSHGEVLVRVKAAGICGSDLHGYRDPNLVWPGQKRPYLSGHELAGEVAALGPGVEGLTVGQLVAVEPRHLAGCGHCRWCRRGDYQVCPELGRRGGERLQSTGFAEYSLEDAGKCYPLSDTVKMEHAAILDVYAVAVHALHRVPLDPMDTVAVIGAGAIGLTTAQVAKAAGARRVIVIDTLDAQLAVARCTGCDETINATKQDPVEVVRELTGGEGAEVVFETVGGKAPTFGQALQMVARGGQVGIIGTLIGAQNLDPSLCQRKEANIHWVYSYGLWNGVPEFQIALDLMARGRVRPAPLITHRFPLERIADGFAAANDKAESGAVKVVVVP